MSNPTAPDESLTSDTPDKDLLNGLTYPLPAVPQPGEALEISPGVKWVRMPLPFSLDHINLYVLADGDGWTIVDTGLKGQKTRDLWEGIFANHLEGRPVTRVIVTHYHPDHVGLAGWLTKRWNCRLWMTRTDFLYGRMLTLDKWDKAPEDAEQFYRAAGFDRAAMDNFRGRAKLGFWMAVDPMPVGYQRLRDGDKIRIGERDWEVVIGRGHAPEHACLWSPAKKLFLSGDQVLPRISSNISVYPTEPEANPLEDWIESCLSLPNRVPDDVLVLPAHNQPFYGLHTRLAQLGERHENALERLLELIGTPRRAADCFSALFRRPIGDGNRGLATGETLAHLNCLIARGDARRRMDGDGVNWYSRCA